MLGVTPVKPVEPSPVQVPAETPLVNHAPTHTMHTEPGHTFHRTSRRSYDKEALEADIREGTLKASTLSEKYGVSVVTVYTVKNEMKKEGRLDAPAPTEKLHEVKELSEDTIEQIQDLRDRNKTTTEIANMLALDFETVASVPARSTKFGKKSEAFRDQFADEDDEAEEEENEADEDDEERYDAFAYRGKVAGSEI